MEGDVAVERRALVSEWVRLKLDRARGRSMDGVALEEFLVAGGIPRLHLASLNGQLEDEELEERYVQYVLGRVFPDGEFNSRSVSALTEWGLVYDLGPYPRKGNPTTGEVAAALARNFRAMRKSARDRSRA